MELSSCIVCEAATQSQGGLINILNAGIDRVFVTAVPFIHPRLTLVLRWKILPGQDGEHKLKIRLMNKSGKDIFPVIEGNIVIPPNHRAMNTVLELNALKFDEAGEYSFEIFIDGRLKQSWPLTVELKSQA